LEFFIAILNWAHKNNVFHSLQPPITKKFHQLTQLLQFFPVTPIQLPRSIQLILSHHLPQLLCFP
jgi:hypothetical protein